MQKILVIGSPGAGKSTFARKLRDLTNLPLYYLDVLWHKPDRTTVTRSEFDEQLQEILQKPHWILDGNYLRTLDVRLSACDTVLLMDFPLEVCLLGAKSRIGKAREDMPWVELEFDLEFEQWIVDFSKDQLPQIYSLLQKYQADRDIHIFKSRDEANAHLKRCRSKSTN